MGFERENLSVVVNNRAVFSDVSESEGWRDARQIISRSFDDAALVLPMKMSARDGSHEVTIMYQLAGILGLVRCVGKLTVL